MPTHLELGISQVCNLACPQCRRAPIYPTTTNLTETLNLIKRIETSDWLNKVPYLRLSGAGETFVNEVLRDCLMNRLVRMSINLLSNGTLFNRVNWEQLKNRYQQIDVEISVDAATAVTYAKVRGGDFKQLMQNLEMLGKLRQQGEIRYFELNFVVQKDNYREMADFVRLAKKLFVDRVHFTHLNNWGTFTYREYRQKCLITRHKKLHRALRRVLRDPILQDPIVDLRCYAPYLKNFARRFPQSLRPLPPYAW